MLSRVHKTVGVLCRTPILILQPQHRRDGQLYTPQVSAYSIVKVIKHNGGLKPVRALSLGSWASRPRGQCWPLPRSYTKEASQGISQL